MVSFEHKILTGAIRLPGRNNKSARKLEAEKSYHQPGQLSENPIWVCAPVNGSLKSLNKAHRHMTG
jgi:hypothetical protein